MATSNADELDDIEDLMPNLPMAHQQCPQVLPKARHGTRPEQPANGTVPGTETVWVKTWGCGHNNSDGEYMAGLLADYGYQITDDADKATLWLLNSCTVKGPSEASFRNAIARGQQLGKHVVLAGCVPQASSASQLWQGYSVLGVQQIDRVVEVVEETLKGHTMQLLRKRKPKNGATVPLALPKIRRNPLIEIVPISSGCLNNCTYCKTRAARGSLISYPIEDIVERVKGVLAEGVREIWLSSEDTGAYGRDTGHTLPQLLWAVLSVMSDGTMLKLGMTNPPYIMEHLEEMAAIFAHPRMYKFIHIPVQAGSDNVLDDMKREYSVADFRYIVAFLREKVPGITIATDIICGFPTETAEDFQATLDLIGDLKLPVVNISQFYPRPGTPAARMKRLDTAEVKSRSRAMTELFNSFQPYSHMVGQHHTVLVTELSADGRYWVAHNEYYDQVLVPKIHSYLGRMLDVTVVSTGRFYVKADVVPESLAQECALPPPLSRGEVSKPSQSVSSEEHRSHNDGSEPWVNVAISLAPYAMFVGMAWVGLRVYRQWTR